MLEYTINPHGAEPQSIKLDGQEYLWQGDPAFWGRRAPILFPIVGKVADDTLRIDGKEFTMKQHGFARDAEFEKKGDRYVMVGDGQRENYPFKYELAVTYRVEGKSLYCEWSVTNKDNKEIHFQIGAHPAFNLLDYNPEDDVHGYLECYDANGNVIIPELTHYLISGLRKPFDTPKLLPVEGTLLPIKNGTFDADAFIIENSQVKAVSLFDKNRNKILTVGSSTAQAYGLWAPSKPGCPFVCLEPWCGITDTAGFKGDISERDLSHSLRPLEEYKFTYWIEVVAERQ